MRQVFGAGNIRQNSQLEIASFITGEYITVNGGLYTRALESRIFYSFVLGSFEILGLLQKKRKSRTHNNMMSSIEDKEFTILLSPL